MTDSNNICKYCKYWFTRETWDEEKEQKKMYLMLDYVKKYCMVELSQMQLRD